MPQSRFFCSRRRAAKLGFESAAYKFVFEGKIITRDTTVKMLELEDGDMIDAIPLQTGGC